MKTEKVLITGFICAGKKDFAAHLDQAFQSIKNFLEVPLNCYQIIDLEQFGAHSFEGQKKFYGRFPMGVENPFEIDWHLPNGLVKGLLTIPKHVVCFGLSSNIKHILQMWRDAGGKVSFARKYSLDTLKDLEEKDLQIIEQHVMNCGLPSLDKYLNLQDSFEKDVNKPYYSLLDANGRNLSQMVCDFIIEYELFPTLAVEKIPSTLLDKIEKPENRSLFVDFFSHYNKLSRTMASKDRQDVLTNAQRTFDNSLAKLIVTKWIPEFRKGE